MVKKKKQRLAIKKEIKNKEGKQKRNTFNLKEKKEWTMKKERKKERSWLKVNRKSLSLSLYLSIYLSIWEWNDIGMLWTKEIKKEVEI